MKGGLERGSRERRRGGSEEEEDIEGRKRGKQRRGESGMEGGVLECGRE